MSLRSGFLSGFLLLISILPVFSQSSGLSVRWESDLPEPPRLRVSDDDPGGDPPSASLGDGFSITFSSMDGLTGSQQLIFDQAAAIWESYLIGYKDGISLDGVTIEATGVYIDGVGETLGSAGPVGYDVQGGYMLATSGIMEFDTADLANLEAEGSLLYVVTHEIAHVLGFGTLWDAPGYGIPGQQVCIDGTGQYTGPEGLVAWQSEFGDSGDSYVPVELDGGAGTADAHWDSLSGVTDRHGNELANELMTGWLAPDPDDVFISQTTVASFGDLGFNVDLSTFLVPEPSSTALLALSLLLFVGRHRRHPA